VSELPRTSLMNWAAASRQPRELFTAGRQAEVCSSWHLLPSYSPRAVCSVERATHTLLAKGACWAVSH